VSADVPERLRRLRRERLGRLAAAVLAGFLVAGSLPPWGFWPLALVGVSIAMTLLASEPDRRDRSRLGFAFGATWFAIGCGWMYQLTGPGYVAVIVIFGLMSAGGWALAPSGRRAWLGGPIALTLAEALRFSWPVGGVPVASLPISQVAGPLASIGRLGGPVLTTLATFAVGSAAAALARRESRRIGALLAIGLVVLVVGGSVVPHGHRIGTVRMALVQGGGPQGTRAINDDSAEVFRRHEQASSDLPADVQVVVWPENVISVPDGGFSESALRLRIETLARTQGVPYVVGVTDHPNSDDSFENSQVVVAPDGTLRDQYAKVRRVPFGEYIPMRKLFKALGVDPPEVPRDAIAGTGPAIVDVPGVGRLAVVISWEVFFGGRARDGVSRGGEVLINPTNGSSYTGAILQTQQVASSRLRAIETGRWVAQVSPTGFTAFVSPNGHVYQRTGQVERAVPVRTIDRRKGLTPYTVLGDKPFVFALLFALLFLLRRGKPIPESDCQNRGSRPDGDDRQGEAAPDPRD
jgi:apolipoprotein N-acyltransferase